MLPVEALTGLFPFHLACDRAGRVSSVGPSLARIYPALRAGDLLVDHFRPLGMPFDVGVWRARAAAGFALAGRTRPIELRGALLAVDCPELLLLLGSPADDPAALGLERADFAAYDRSFELHAR